jgi:predicted transcriptional regulator
VTLTTNDVRVLRLLIDNGPLTRSEIAGALRYGLGAEPALRRLARLHRDGLVEVRDDTAYDVTGAGVRALRAADLIAYGRAA